jgi:N(2)-fixation sustaining protein CowN
VGGEEARPDRYKSFTGIDCDGQSRELVAAIRRHIDDPSRSDAFWEAFKTKLAEASDTGRHPADQLRILCAAVGYIEELLERNGDTAGIALLHRLEEECC